ncbi:MAG TPA: class III poly(R)-hydroxyalkanoic acid synthase subunit PhaC [Xanthobacteraceae bacterium]|nr:class III poly(R)-hydroxyalkanoic acid synthase subunit PhaC [Xanthobacteraceae bacterium]
MTEADRTQANVTEAFREASALGRKVMDGAQLLANVRDEEVAIATTEKDEIWRSDKVVLYRYRPMVERKLQQPLLIVFSLVGNYRIVDLQEDRSLVRNLLRSGIPVYVIDWGHPSRADRFLGMDDYINDYLAGAVDAVSQQESGERVNVLGICEGGTFSLCYAALDPTAVQNLVLIVTPIDFHAEDPEKRLGHGFINMWTRNIKPEDLDRLLAAHGNLPGELMGSIFASMTPMRTLLKYNLDLMEIAGDKSKLLNFLRMEKWLADRPHHPGEVARQWIKDLYQQNKLIKGEFVLGQRRVDLAAVSMPVLNIYANDDHIIPPAMTRNVGPRLGTKDYTEVALPAGHMGVFVSGKAQGLLGEKIATWLFAHQQTQVKG